VRVLEVAIALSAAIEAVGMDAIHDDWNYMEVRPVCQTLLVL
jgi:hypothetical protein